MPGLGDRGEAGAEGVPTSISGMSASGTPPSGAPSAKSTRNCSTNDAAAALAVSTLTRSPSEGLLLAPTPRWSAATTTALSRQVIGEAVAGVLADVHVPVGTCVGAARPADEHG